MLVVIAIAGLIITLLPATQAGAAESDDVGIASPPMAFRPYKSADGNHMVATTQWHQTNAAQVRLQRHSWRGWLTEAKRMGSPNPWVSWNCDGSGNHNYRTRLYLGDGHELIDTSSSYRTTC